MHMRKSKYVLAVTAILGLSLGTVGCFKPSKDSVIDSDYYQELKEKNEKLSSQLKMEKRKTSSLNKKIKAIHETSGDQKIAEYKSAVKGSRIVKVSFVSNTAKDQSFAVTNRPVCSYAKKIVAGCYRMIGITSTDVEKKYDKIYSYALIDEDNTTYEFRVYGNSYIIFDEIPENVYAFNDAALIGDALIDAEISKNYDTQSQRIGDAQIVVTDQKMKFNDTAVQVSKILRKCEKDEVKQDKINTEQWKEYRFYTSGTLTKVLVGDQDMVCIEKKDGKQFFYQISAKNLKKLKNLLDGE